MQIWCLNFDQVVLVVILVSMIFNGSKASIIIRQPWILPNNLASFLKTTQNRLVMLPRLNLQIAFYFFMILRTIAHQTQFLLLDLFRHLNKLAHFDFIFISFKETSTLALKRPSAVLKLPSRRFNSYQHMHVGQPSKLLSLKALL